MATCETCGNEVPDEAWTCPYCESPRLGLPGPPRRRPPSVVTVNLKAGLPTVEQAMARLERELAAAVAGGSRVVRIVHGYGSSGRGGGIREEVRRHLGRHGARFGVRRLIPGDDYAETTDAGREALRAHPVLRDTLRTDRLNPGITFALL